MHTVKYKLTFLFLFFLYSATANSQLLDKVILEMDGLHFTQREIETYWTVKSMFINARSGYYLEEISEKNWIKVRDDFVDDMLISADAKRLSNNIPQAIEVKKTVAKVMEQTAKNIKLQEATLNRLGLKADEIANIIYTVMQIELHEESKKIGIENQTLNNSQNNFRITQLREKALIRWYNQSENYTAIDSLSN